MRQSAHPRPPAPQPPSFPRLSPYTHPAARAHNTRLRARRYTGSILLALNPFQPVPALFGPDAMARYQSADALGGAPLAPHVYAVACQAYRQMVKDGAGQAILVRG